MSSQEPEFNPDDMSADESYDELLRPFDVHEGSSRQGMIKLMIGAAILLSLAFLVLKLYQPGVRDRGDPPLITADNTPFKVVPEDREGAQTPDQDKEIFDVMGGQETDPDVVTLPTPEVPISLPERTEPGERPSANDPEATVQSPVVEDTRPVTPPQPAPQTTEPSAPAPQRPAPVQPRPAASSDWVVQVASLRTQVEADQTYSRVENQFSSLLRPYRSDIRRVDLAEKGIYYRVRIAGFGDKASAAALCEQLKNAGQACYVTR